MSEERLGRKRMYRLEPGPLTEVDRWLSAYRVFWVARLIDLKEMLESEPSGEGDTQEKNS